MLVYMNIHQLNFVVCFCKLWKVSSYSTSVKGDLMQSAVSGLNRGLAASEEDLKRADSAAKELEAVGGPVDLYKDLDKLQGRWKLIYSSAFSSRTLGGSRPGPPTGRLLPITLGQVYTRCACAFIQFHLQLLKKFLLNAVLYRSELMK